MNLCVIITAAGESRRYGDSDKLSEDLGGRPVLVRTVEVFTRRDEVGSIIVTGPPDGNEVAPAFREKYGPVLGFHGVHLIAGSRGHRWESVRNAMAAIPDEATHVAVHDAARPAVSAALLDRLLLAAAELEAVIPGTRQSDTLRRVSLDSRGLAGEDDAIADSILGDAGKARFEVRAVTETLDRDGLILVQTPQVFNVDLLRRAYAQDELEGATDDAELILRLGEPVHVVDGDPGNIKLTSKEDLSLLRSILRVPPPKERPVHKRF